MLFNDSQRQTNKQFRSNSACKSFEFKLFEGLKEREKQFYVHWVWGEKGKCLWNYISNSKQVNLCNRKISNKKNIYHHIASHLNLFVIPGNAEPKKLKGKQTEQKKKESMNARWRRKLFLVLFSCSCRKYEMKLLIFHENFSFFGVVVSAKRANFNFSEYCVSWRCVKWHVFN